MQNLESKYNHFIKAGVTSLPASYAEFETAMKDKTGGAQKIYDGLKNEGVELPDFNEFYSVMMPEETKVQPAAKPQVKPATQSQQAVQPSTPKAGTPMTDSDKKGMMANAEVLKSNIETSVDNTAQRLNNLAKVNQPLKTDVKLGTQVSKVGDKYITTAGNDYDTPEQAKVEQFMIDESQSQRKREVYMVRARELEDDINKEKENLKKIKSTAIKTSGGFMPSDGGYLPYDPTAASESEKKIRELEQERRKVMMPMISGQLTDVNSRIETLNDEINNLKGGKAEKYSFGPSATTRVDDKVRLKNKELSLAMEERDALELMINGDDKNFFSGLIYGITRPYTYTFGLYDLAMSQDMTKAKNAYDKGALTDDQKQFMAAYERANTAKSELDQNAGSQFRFGNIAAQSAPFMLEFFGTGGMGGIQTTATALARLTAKKLTKDMAKGMVKNLTKGLIKNTGIALGDIAAAGTMAVTTGGARTASDIINRYTGHPVQTDTGFTFKDGTTLADAVYKGLTSSTIEYYTEMLGTHMESVFPWIKSVIGKRMSQFAENVKGTKMGLAMAYGSIGLKKLGELADKSGIKAIYNDSKKAMKLFGLQSYPYEALEEEAGIVLNSMLTGDNKISDLVDGRTQEDIWGGMLYSIGMMQGITGGISAKKYYGLKHKLSNQDVVCSNLFGDQWASIKEQIDNATNANLLKTIFNVRTKSAEERKALLVYGGVLSQFRGFNSAVFGETEDKAANNTPSNPVSDAVNRGFTDGYNSTDEETARIENDLNDKKGLLNYDPGMSESEQFQSDVVRLQDNQEDALDYLIERYGEQHIGLATDYYNALNVYNGLTQRKADEDDDRLTHLNQQAERNEYKGQEGQSGNVITADMGGNKVYIVRGDVNTETGEMSGAIVVRDEQGKIIVTNGNALTLESVRPLEEIKQENAEIVAAERLAKEQEMKLAEEQQQEEQQIDQQQQPQDQPQDNQEQPQDNQEQQQDNQEQPQEPIEEMPMIGEGEEAEPDFYSVAPSRSRAFIYDESDLSEDETNEYVDANIEESNKKVKSLEKKKPKASTSINKYKKELDAWKQELEQAKKKADYWQQVKDEHLQKKEETPQNVEANTEDVNQAPAVENAPAEEQVNQQEETHTNEMIDDNENSNYQLSDEADDNGHQFVLNTDGNLEFGQISEETGLTPAPILLSEGIITNTKTNAGYGLVHIEARHGDQIRAAGYKSVLEFINDVAKNYESIRKGKKRDGRDTYLLQFTDKHNNTLMIELSRNGKYWNINTAGIFKTSYGANKTEVYNRHTTDNQPAGTDEVSLSGEQSGTTPSTRMNTPTQQPSDGSADKVTNTPDNNQVETEKKDESKSGVKESRVVGGNSGYVGYSMSKRAAQAREEGRFPKTDFKKVYGLSDRAFDMLVRAGIIDDSEWHHTSKFGNKTTFYSWAEDVYAKIYAANKKEFDAIAKKYNFKNQFELPDVGYGKLPREYRIEYRKLDDDRWKERNALRDEYKGVEDGPRREEYLEKDRKIMEKYDSMEKELEKKYPEYAAYKENEKNWRNRADEISRDRKKMIEEVRSLMNEKEQDMYLRDAVIELLQQSGIEVVTNEEEAQRVLDEAHRMLDNGDIREHKLSLSYYPRLAISPVRGKWTKSKIIKRLKDIVGTKKGYSFAARRIAEFDSAEELAEHMFYHGSQFGSGRLKPSILMSDSEVERIGGGGYGQKYWGISVSRSKRIASNFSTGISVRVYPIILVKNAKIKEMPELSDAADLEDYIEDLWEEGVDAVWIGDKNRGEQELCVINPAAIVNIDNPDIYKSYKLGTSENPINIIDKDGINKLYQDAKRYVNALENKPKKPEKPSRFLPAKDGETIGEMKSDEQYQKEMSEYERKLDEYNNSDEVRRFQQEDEYAYRNIRFFKTPSGHAYGFTVDGKIYVDKKIAGSETPIHEYSHLWAAAMRQVNPEEWKNIVNLMKGTTLWEEVKKMYPELTTDDDIADEVLAHYSGKRGAERLKKAQEEAMKQEGLMDKAAALSAIYRVKEALSRFWKGVADFLGVHFTSAEEVADKVLSDLLNGVNPAGVAKNSEVRYQFIGEKGAAEIDAAEEATTRLDNLRVAREMEKNFNTRKKRINKLYNSEFVTVDFNNEFELNRDSAKEWIKKNLRREYKNGDTGDIIELSKIGINKVTSHGERDEAHLKSLVSIPKMIEKSVFIDELPNTKGNDKFDSYRYYACGLKIDGNDYTAKIVVGVKGNNKYYDHRLTEIEKGNLIDNLNGMAKSVAENQNASLSVGKDTKLLSILQINEQENAKKIKLATGWERGADGKWRYEILDGKFDRNGELHPERRRLSEEEHKFLEDNFEETMQAFKKGSLAYGKEITEDTDMADIYESGGMERKKAERIRSLEDKEERLIKEPKRLDDYLDSEELFTAYPELRDIEIDTSNPNAALYGHLASYDPTNKVIKLNDTSFDTLSHEVQHAIQYIEGFAKGGSSNNIRKRIKDIIDQNKDASEYAKSRLRQYAEAKVNQFFLEGSYDTLIKSDNPAIKRHAIEKYWEAMNFIDNEEASTLVNDYPNMSPDDIALSGYHVTEAAQELKRLAKSYKEDIPEANMDALNLVQKLEQSLQDKNDTQLYASIAGEVESRNVQKRLGMPMEIRRELLASETEDVAREDQIILEEGLGLNYSSTEGNPPKVKDGFTLYVAKDGSKIVSRSLFRDEDFKQIEAASEGASKGRAVRRKTVFSPARIRLRKLKEGETCSVERRYVENGMFDFTGKEKIESDADVAYIFRQLENAAVENCFMVLLKDGRPTVIHISMGSYSSTMAPFEQAFVAYSALKPDKVYFVHNHPSGNLKASRQDRDMLDRMKKMFGSDVVNPGIIIDTTSGKYGVFDGINIEEDMPVRQEGEVPLKVYNFSKQVFSPGWNPMESFKIKSPDDVAAFVSSHRLGEHEKMSFLVLGNDNSVVANVFLPYTKLSDIEEQGELKSATDMMAGYVHQCGGTRGIIYGNYDYTSTDGKLLSKISLRMKELGAPLLDAIHIEHSAMDEGVIGEPGVDGISLETVNKRFNNELERYQNREMASSEMLHLGNPLGVMRKFLPNIPIVMRQRILNKGAVKKHNVDVSSLSDMPQYLSSPIFVFQRNDNTLGVLTEMKDRDGKNICVAIEINRQIQDGGDILEVNDIRSVHGRNIADIIYPIINNETLKWVDKEKGLSYLSSASRYVQQEIDKKDLISATKVVKEFKNPIIEEDKNDLKDENISLTEEDANLYRQVEDEETEEWLEGQPTIKTYRSMVLIDGKLYPPMSSKAFGSKELRNPSELGKWEEAEEAPDKAKKKGDRWYYTLTKDNGKQVRDVAYNPYIHTSTTMLNDQFSEAQSRDNLVVVEMEVPASELSSSYKAKKATDSVGVKQWKAGVIQGKLSGTREVVLTRWAKPVRVVPVEEVADNIVEMIDGKIDVMPSNVVTPQQRKALEERGIKFIETDNSGKIKYGENAGKTWASVYGGKKSNKANKQETKSPQNPKFTKAQEESAVKREKQRIGNAAREMAARLGIEDDVEFIETNEGLTGRKATAKGWFNRKTGKIVVVLGNHISQTDVLRTIIHEGVAHYGLRKLLGERFDTFLDEIFKNAEQEVKESILELSKKHGYNVRTATEEYLASLAEKMDFEKAKNSGWWTKIKSMFLDMMRQLGLGTYVGPALTDNELRYLLWRSYENLAEPGRMQNPFAEAKDTSKQLELKVGGYENRSGRVNATSEKEGDLLFRDGDFTERDEAIARDAYENAMRSGRVQFIEEVQDSMRSLVELYKAILGKKTLVEDIEGFENPYMFENRLSSMNMAQQHLYFIDYMKPVLKAISRICKGNDKKREELINYMMAKHGLERNLVFAERDAKQKAMEEFAKELKAAEKSVFDDPLDANAVAALDDVKIRMQQREEELFFQNREKDYGGITGLMGIENLKDAEEAARTLVDDYEWEHDLYITDLWDAVNAATQATLDKVYESGIISKESYESIRDMFQYYIPLQGWDETTSDEIYAYLIDRKQMAGAPIKHAKGRRSKADDPIATIGMRGEMAVMQANRNLMKQTFLNFVLGHPSDLVSVSELWLEHDEVNDVWIPVFVDIEEGDTGEDIKRKTEAFEQQMEALQKQDPKKYKKSSQAQNIPYKVVPGNLKAHQVIVKRNGKSYVLTINGNPKAAMALNGLTNPDVEQKGFNKIMNAATYVNRKLSIAYTTANINFTVSNFVRDMVYSNTMAWIKESPWYAINFHWNCGKYNPAMLRRLFGKWENGTLNLNNNTEKLFYDFIKNGGETGFSNVRDIDAQKKFINSELKKENSLSRKAIALLASQLDMLNRSVENTARFAAFVTSREVGRSIERSVYDAKEVSVNFNKKGSGGRFLGEKGQTALGNVGSVIGGSGRIGYVFWNAGIQGLSNIGKNMGRHKIKGIAGLAAMYVLGRVIPMLYGDDDDNSYYDIPEKVRRSNICIKVGEQWVTISLPIEFRAIYGLGELATGVESKNDVYTDKELAYQIGSQISQILPIDFLEGDGGVKNFVPTLLRPSFEAYINESWTGLPIYKDTPWNKNMPGWTKAYKNANVQLVDFAKFVSEITGGDEYKKGAIDINPAQVEHVLSGLFGGYVIMGNQLIKMAETATGERDFDWRNMIIANRVITNGDERVKEKRTTGMYYKIKEEVEEKRRLINSYRKDEMDEKADKLETPEYENALEDLKESQKNIKQIKEMIDETSDKDIQKELNKLIRQEEKTFVERHKKILK